MNKGRGYPHTKHFWKCVDFRPGYYLPRQLTSSVLFYDHAGGLATVWDGVASATDRPGTLQEAYIFPTLTYGGVDVEYTIFYDGTNDLSKRGMYGQMRASNGGREDWFYQSIGMTSVAGDESTWKIIRDDWVFQSPFPIRVEAWLFVDWHSYPQKDGWTLDTSFPRRDALASYRRTRNRLAKLGNLG